MLGFCIFESPKSLALGYLKKIVDTIYFFNSEEEEVGTVRSLFIWMGLVEKPTPVCPTTVDVFQV